MADGSDTGLDPATDPTAAKPTSLQSMDSARPEHNKPGNGAGGQPGTHQGHADDVPSYGDDQDNY